MENRILVAYASKRGATKEIAEKIGQVLRQSGLQADVMPVDRAGNLTPYPAVVLGSAVYYGHWRKEAAAFLKANEKLLAGRMVWLFSSGPTGQGAPDELAKGTRIPQALQTLIDSIRPRDIALFHGVIDEKKLSFFEKFVAKKVKAPTGDFRDWDAVTSWAMAIAGALKK
ncbi:MAG: flavodoxin domain-containing protein [Candidatus Aminicenantales bacterium]